MNTLESVHGQIKAKKQIKKSIEKSFKDEFANNPRYQQIVEQLKLLREEKKSIENQVYAQAADDVQKLESLKLDIKADQEMLSDIALNMYVKGETVEVVDEQNQVWQPKFNVKMEKSDEERDDGKEEAAA